VAASLPHPEPKIHDLRGGNREHLFWPPAGRKATFISFDFAASPQNQTKKIVISLLPQAKMP
jgi:hypothetical protein